MTASQAAAIQAALKRLLSSMLSPSGGVNASQATAIQAALKQTLTLWQGPPGTGKTSTLLRFLQIASQGLFKGKKSRVVACAASNVAVDGLTSGLLRLGVHVVRVGQAAKVSRVRNPSNGEDTLFLAASNKDEALMA